MNFLRVLDAMKVNTVFPIFAFIEQKKKKTFLHSIYRIKIPNRMKLEFPK